MFDFGMTLRKAPMSGGSYKSWIEVAKDYFSMQTKKVFETNFVANKNTNQRNFETSNLSP